MQDDKHLPREGSEYGPVPEPRTDGSAPELTIRGQNTGVFVTIRSDDGIGRRVAESPAQLNFHVAAVRLRRFKAERWHDGRPVHDPAPCVGSSAFTYAGVYSTRVVQGPWRTLSVFVPVQFERDIASQIELAPLNRDRVPRALTYDPAVHRLAHRFVAEISEVRAGTRLQLDALCTELCVHLLRRTSDKATGHLAATGGLTVWQLRRVQEYVEAGLANQITLQDLAQQARLSQFHFARAFKQSIGLSPHQHLLQRRIERAKQLLTDTDESIAAVASQVGYEDPTQLARLFKSRLNLTPSQYRRIVRT